MATTNTVTGTPIYKQPAELLRHLIRFDTTNPPGNERECILYINGLLRDAGFDTVVVGLDDNRPNLIARLKGKGTAPALLMQGHVDVVTTEKQDWQHPPFEADLVDGYIWGRGALDMKQAVAMMVSAFMRAKAEGLEPAGDVVLAVVSDEEAGGDYGAKYLVENHPQLFDGVRYGIGEFGGFTLHVAGRKFYPIQVAEKQICWLRAIVRGPGGHGSRPIRGGAMAKLGRMLTTLDQKGLPVHITSVVQSMVQAMAAELPAPMRESLTALLDPQQTEAVLPQLGPLGDLLDAILRNTASPTIVHGGSKVNVIPSEIVVELDGRLLPGYTPDDMLAELHSLLGDDVELEIVRFNPYPAEPDMALFSTLAGILREADPQALPIPYMLSGVTDAAHFAKLGIQSYGFTPMNLPEGFNFSQTIHAADERIPVSAVEFGAEAIYKLLGRFGT